MKTFLAAVLILASVTISPAPTTNAPAVLLAWDQTSDTNVIAYGLYWGTGGSYTNSVIVLGRANTSATVSNLVRGVTYSFAATCRTTNLESIYSVPVSYTPMPLPPPPFNVNVTIVNP